MTPLSKIEMSTSVATASGRRRIGSKPITSGRAPWYVDSVDALR
jgi:hypothetical protein